jgi:hypothetical protein
MYTTRRHEVGGRTVGTLLALIVLATVAALLATGLVACGKTDVVGTYKFQSGSDKQMANYTLALNGDKTFKLDGTDPVSGKAVTLAGTYTLDGDKITLEMAHGVKTDPGTVDGGQLVFKKVTWVKQ